MKLAYILCFLSSPLMAATFMGQANLKNEKTDAIIVVGQADLKNVRASSVTVTGPLEFKQLTVTGPTSVTGPMDGEKGSFEDVTVTGEAKLKEIEARNLTVTGALKLKDKSKITGKIDVTGDLDIAKSQVQDIVVTADEIKLKDVRAGNITVRKNQGSTKIQLLKLEDCTINGNIVFEAGQGLIKKDSDVRIMGTVKGAELQKK